jgi:hypothetical protein
VFYSPKCLYLLWSSSSLLFKVYQIFPGGKTTRANPSPLTMAEIQNECSYRLPRPHMPAWHAQGRLHFLNSQFTFMLYHPPIREKTHTRTHTRTCVRMHTRTHTRMRARTPRMHARTPRTRARARAHTHTHTHTHTELDLGIMP